MRYFFAKSLIVTQIRLFRLFLPFPAFLRLFHRIRLLDFPALIITNFIFTATARYIIIPVEVATSIFWYSAFYLTLQSGFDIIALLESMGASEATLAKLPSAEAGYHALAFILYKVSHSDLHS